MRYDAWYPIVDAQYADRHARAAQDARVLAYRQSNAPLQVLRRTIGNLIERCRVLIARFIL